MIQLKHKLFFIKTAGFIWGLSGFTFELVAEGANQKALIVRFLFMFISSLVIFLTVPFRLKKSYVPAILLLLIYLLTFTYSTFINNSTFNILLREILLNIAALAIYLILFDKEQLDNFIKGIFSSLSILIIFYSFNINFTKMLQPLYRLSTHLNPNGIGSRSAMLFAISLYLFIAAENKRKKILYSILFIVSFLVILATRSRTSLVMAIIAFFTLILLLKMKKTFIISAVFLVLIVFLNYQTISTVLRISIREDQGRRTLSNLTGRTEIWNKGLTLISKNFLFGVGPDRAQVRVQNHMGSFHNAYIQLFVMVGFVGFFPILILLFNAFKNVIFFKNDVLLKLIFITGIFGSLSESRLLNFGSPGNLLFFISFLYFNTFNFTKTIPVRNEMLHKAKNPTI